MDPRSLHLDHLIEEICTIAPQGTANAHGVVANLRTLLARLGEERLQLAVHAAEGETTQVRGTNVSRETFGHVLFLLSLYFFLFRRDGRLFSRITDFRPSN